MTDLYICIFHLFWVMATNIQGFSLAVQYFIAWEVNVLGIIVWIWFYLFNFLVSAHIISIWIYAYCVLKFASHQTFPLHRTKNSL